MVGSLQLEAALLIHSTVVESAKTHSTETMEENPYQQIKFPKRQTTRLTEPRQPTS